MEQNVQCCALVLSAILYLITLNMNINAQQAILNAYITNNSSLYKIYSANVSLLHRNIIRAI